MKIYRQHNIIKQGFQQLKNEVASERLQATETTYRGKIFLYSIVQAVRMSTLQAAKSIKLPDDSLRKLLVQLKSADTLAPQHIRVRRRHRAQEAPQSDGTFGHKETPAETRTLMI